MSMKDKRDAEDQDRKIKQELEIGRKNQAYNFPRRVTDHRINFTLHKLEEFMQGEIFDEMIENLNIQAQQEKLTNLN